MSDRIKFCICGHVVESHDMKKGCTEVVEGSKCEDHWLCGCMCVQCIHLNAYRNMQKKPKKNHQKQKRGVEQKAETDWLVNERQ